MRSAAGYRYGSTNDAGAVRADSAIGRARRFRLIASAIAGRPVEVAPVEPGERPWTDGVTVFADADASPRDQLRMRRRTGGAAGCREPRPRGRAGPRAAPGAGPPVSRRGRAPGAGCAGGPAADGSALPHRPRGRGTKRVARRVVGDRHGSRGGRRPAGRSSARSARGTSGHASSRRPKRERPSSTSRDGNARTCSASSTTAKTTTASSRISSRARSAAVGCSDGCSRSCSATHARRRAARLVRTRRHTGHARAARVARTVALTTANASMPDHIEPSRRAAPRTPNGTCTGDATGTTGAPSSRSNRSQRTCAPLAAPETHALRRPLARLGMELERRRRQLQGDDIDIDAAVEARVESLAGSPPDEAMYIESQRRRRDLAVLLLLDVSGSSGETERDRRHGTRASAGRGGCADRGPPRPRRPRRAVRVPLPGSVGRPRRAGEALPRRPRHARDVAPRRSRSRRLHAPRRSDPSRCVRPRARWRDVEAVAGRSVRRLRLRPRLRGPRTAKPTPGARSQKRAGAARGACA